MTMPLQICFLGGLRIQREGTPAVSRLRTAKTTALLAFLCAYPGRDHGREELVERFWPDLPFDDGRNSLRVALSALRRTLESPDHALPSEEILRATRSHIRLLPGAIETDVARLEAALRRGDRAQAAALAAHGSFLPGVNDEWVFAEQARIEALRDEVLTESSEPIPATSRRGTQETAAEPASRGVSGSVPLPLGHFFGRETETAQLLSLLADPTTRLTTLTGPGGIGKTRLAVETACALREGKAIFPPGRLGGGVWFVPLVAATQGGQILPALCRAVGAELGGNNDALETLADHLRRGGGGYTGGQTIVVLDNLEQIEPEGCAATLRDLLGRVPEIVCLATSRRRVGLPGERVVALSPFPLPAADDSLGSLAAHPAVALFVDRAREADVDFVLTSRRAPQIVDLCARLNGVPLALEMAASWAGVYTPDEMAALAADDTGGDALPGRHAGRESRHRSLRAVAEWSIRLLPSDARELLANLSVFQGRWTREAASHVAKDSFTTDRLALLCDHSLVASLTEESEREASAPRRFQIMPALRPFARELLAETDEGGAAAQEAQEAHARYFTDAALANKTDIDTLPDTLAALAFWENAPQGLNQALLLVGALWTYWWNFGQWDEAQMIARRVLARVDAASEGEVSPEALREALRCAGKLAFYRHDFEAARDFMDRRLALAIRNGNQADIAYLHANFATLDIAAGRYEDACAAFEALLPTLPSIDSDWASEGSYVFSNYADALFKAGRIDDACVAAEAHLRALDRRGLQNDGIQGLNLSLLSEIHRARGEGEKARTCAESSLSIFRVRGEVFRIADVLLLLSAIARESGDRTAALANLRESFTLRRRVPSDDGFRRSVEEAERFLAKWQPSVFTEKKPESHSFSSRAGFAEIHRLLEQLD